MRRRDVDLATLFVLILAAAVGTSCLGRSWPPRSLRRVFGGPDTLFVSIVAAAVGTRWSRRSTSP